MHVALSNGLDVLELVFYVVGGLGLFLYGIRKMGDSLKLLAGRKLKILIERSTNTPLKGIFIGVFVTVLLQTSTGTTALTVSLVRAGLMTFPQALGVILGANLGTTATSFLIGLEIYDYALPMIALGSVLALFSPSLRPQRFGGVLFGFGLIFFGLDLMSNALAVFTEFEGFRAALLAVSDIPILGVLVGAVSTVVVQSSTAVIGILQQLYRTGAMPLIGAVAIVFGSNIGTTVTAILSALGGSTAAKQTAAAHVIFNVGGSIIFLILIVPYTAFIATLETHILGGEQTAMTVSFAHIFFNLFNTVIMYFLITQLDKLSRRIIKGKTDALPNVETLQPSLIKSAPGLALENVKRVIASMGEITEDMYRASVRYSFENDKKSLERGRALEEIIDTIDSKTHDYLIKIAHAISDDALANEQAFYVDTIRDFERICDHCQNLFDFFEYRHSEKLHLTEDAERNLKHLYSLAEHILNKTLEAFKEKDEAKARLISDEEEGIDNAVRRCRREHVLRSSKDQNGADDVLFVDILSNIERIGDHCENIARNLLDRRYYFR